MVKKTERWNLAQEHELRWWEQEISRNDLSYFKRFATMLTEEITGVFSIEKTTGILELGSGPAGIMTFLPSDKKIGLDPLEYFYGRVKKCREFRAKNACYVAAQAEGIPFPDNHFEFIIIDNILDHCEDIDKVFKEMKRVLVPGGFIYLRNFTSTNWGLLLGTILELFMIDKGHPYHFTDHELRRLFTVHRLEPVRIKKRGFLVHNWNLLASGKKNNILRALSLSQSDKVTYLLKNNK